MQRTSRSVGCCGITEIYGFDDYFAERGYPRAEANTIPFVLTGHRAGIAIATTAGGSYGNNRESIRHLEAHGFYPVLTTRNPKTDNPITLWVRDLSEGKKPVRLSRKPWLISRLWHKGGYLKRLLRPWNAAGKGPYVDNKIHNEGEE